MQKVAGERYVYKFVCNPEALFQIPPGPAAGSSGDHHQRMLKFDPGKGGSLVVS